MKIGFNLTLAAVFSAAALTVQAQTAAPAPTPKTAAAPAGDDVITLSPFVVDATKDRGYAATNTLAGSRLNSRLADTPSAISVMTPELLQDIGATNIDTAISFGTNTEVNRNDDNSGYRIRGITSSVSRSRNLFLVSGDQVKSSSDLYNVDRVTTSRGPNAILYGNADPAGVVDVTTKKADLRRNLGEFAQQVDNQGSGARGSIDWNQVIIPDRLALRVDAMYQDVAGFRMDSPQRDKNIYLTGTAVLLKKDNYTLSASFDYENDNGVDNYMRVNQQTEQYSYWQASGSPVVGAYSGTVKPTYAVGTKAFSTASQIVFVGGAAVSVPIMDWKNSGVSNSPTILDPNLGKTSTGSNLPLLNGPFPLYSNLYGDTAAREQTNVRYRTISLTQQIGHDLYIEAAYNDFRGTKWRPWSSGGFTTVYIDPNGFLPNGAVNPNEGKYFTDRIQQPQDYTFIDSTVRVGVAYQLNLAQKTNNWLGKNNFAFSYDHRKSGRYIDNYIEVNTTPLAAAGAAAQIGAANYLSTSTNNINRRYYLDPVTGVIAAGDVTQQVNGNGVVGALLRTKAPTVTQGRSTSYSQALQSFWLKDHLVTTVGIRQDTADSYGISATPTRDARGVYAPATTLLGSAPIANFKVNTKSYGAVVHITDSISIFGNKSDNFSPDVTRTDVYGGVIPPTVGKGEDYGLKLDLLDSRLSVSLGRYTNSKDNTVITGGSAPGDNFTPIWQALGVANNDPRYPGGANGAQYNYTQSNKSKGTELEITFNPTPNWRIRATGDKNDTVFSSFAPQYAAYFAKYQALWAAADQTLVGGGQTIATSISNIQKQLTLNNAQLASATLVTPYQANVITSYIFPKSSVLKNFFIGGSESYAAATIIGFPNVNTTDPTKANFGQTIADTTRPYKGRDIYTTGLWLGYERKISSYGHKIKWRMQLNVNNVLNDQDPIPFGVRAQDGAISNVQLRAPREFVFRNSFSF